MVWMQELPCFMGKHKRLRITHEAVIHPMRGPRLLGDSLVLCPHYFKLELAETHASGCLRVYGLA